MSAVLFFSFLHHIASSSIINTAHVSNASGDYFIASQVSMFGTHYKGNTISCPTNSANPCYISCDRQDACKGTKIWAKHSTVLIIDCIASSSCEGAELVNGPTKSLSIACKESLACSNAVFKFNTTTAADIHCHHDTNTSHDHSEATCNNTMFYGMQTLNTTVLCDSMDCAYSYFHLNNSQNVTFRMRKPSTETLTLPTTIYGPHITKSLTVQCIGSHSCRDNTIVCPYEASCNFECDAGSACDFDIYVPSKEYNHLYLGSHTNYTTSISGRFHCIDTDTNENIQYQTDRAQFGCDVLDADDCCPLWNTLGAERFVCDHGIHCATDCEGATIIDASKATSLTVTAGSNCAGSRVICPMDGSACNIFCDSESVCQDMRVDLYDLDVLNISCTAHAACAGMQIWPPQRADPVVQVASLQCTGSNSCEDMTFGYRAFIDEMTIQCSGYRSCFGVQFPTTKGDNGRTVATTIDTSLQINCSASLACNQMNVKCLTNDNSSATYNTICNNPKGSNNRSGACYEAFFELATAEDDWNVQAQFSLSCNRFDCQQMEFNARAHALSIDCDGAYACRDAIFRTASVDELNVTCAQSNACRDATVYQNGGHILCAQADSVCQDMTIVALEGTHDVALTCGIDLNEGDTLPCDGMRFQCAINSEYDTYLHYDYGTHLYDGCMRNHTLLERGDECCPNTIGNLVPTTTTTSLPTAAPSTTTTISSTAAVSTGATVVSESTISSTGGEESKDSDSSKSIMPMHTALIIVGGAVAGAVFVGLIVWCLVCRKKKKRGTMLLGDAYDDSVGRAGYRPPKEQEITTL